ncbi:hypothetical protein BGZ82_008040 [Podila clonocystis]|nr:hypothetical protein BGZ82_008040 [Podila clonocystis]
MCTRDLTHTIDLEQYCMTGNPSRRDRAALNRLMTKPVKKAEWSDVVALAGLYKLTELQALLVSYADPYQQLKFDLTHMVDAKMANFAFAIEDTKPNRDVAVWVHQSKLVAHGGQSKRLHCLPTPMPMGFISADQVQE